MGKKIKPPRHPDSYGYFLSLNCCGISEYQGLQDHPGWAYEPDMIGDNSPEEIFAALLGNFLSRHKKAMILCTEVTLVKGEEPAILLKLTDYLLERDLCDVSQLNPTQSIWNNYSGDHMIHTFMLHFTHQQRQRLITWYNTNVEWSGMIDKSTHAWFHAND